MSQFRPRIVDWVGLATCMATGPFLLYALSAVAPLVVRDLDLSSTQYGLIATVTFGAAAVGTVALPVAVARLRTTGVMALVSAGSGAGVLVVAGAANYTVVLLGAVMCGLAQAMSNPATNAFVVGLPARARGLLVGWKQSGVQMSQLAAGATAPPLAALAGWRLAVGTGAGVAVIGVLSALLMSSPDAGRPEHREAGSGRSSRMPWLILYTFLTGAGLAATNAYLPLFAHEELGMPVAVAGLLVVVVAAVGLVSRIWWGRRGVTRQRAPVLLCWLAAASLVGVACCLASTVVDDRVVWVGAAVFGASALAANSVTMSTVIATVSAVEVTVASSRVATGLYVGFAAGPVGFGVLLDHLTFAWAWALPCALFLLGTATAGWRHRADQKSENRQTTKTPTREATHADA